MSRLAVRRAVQAFLTTPGIVGLEKVYLDQPTRTLGGDWQLANNAGWGAVGWTHISDESETRITLPAVTGQKQVKYTVGLALLYQYLIPANPPAGDHEDAWVTYMDTLIDNVKARLRSDPTMGTGPGGVVFQGAQDPDSLKIASDLPRLDHGKVWVWHVLEFDVTEVVTA